MSVKVIDLDIHRADRVEGLAGYEAVEILFRAGRTPVGRARIPCDCDFLKHEQLSPFLENLTPPAADRQSDRPLPTVTVAVCTRNRHEELTAALNSLARQEHEPEEILVIDNGCQEEVRELVERTLPRGRYIPERRVGLDFARNRAIAAATGDILAYLDDDAVADPFWVQAIAESFAGHPTAGVVTGLTPPMELGNAGSGAVRILLWIHARLYTFYPAPGRQAFAGNAGTPHSRHQQCRHWLQHGFQAGSITELNGFDEAFDTGRPLPGGGDLDMFHRVVRAGYQLVYEPQAVVRHRHRRTEAELVRQLTGHQRAFIALIVKFIFVERGLAQFGAILFLASRLEKAGRRMLFGLLTTVLCPAVFF